MDLGSFCACMPAMRIFLRGTLPAMFGSATPVESHAGSRTHPGIITKTVHHTVTRFPEGCDTDKLIELADHWPVGRG